jgi:hypothetical protein
MYKILSCPWQQLWSTEHSCVYYYNRSTQASSWKAPADGHFEGLSEEQPAAKAISLVACAYGSDDEESSEESKEEGSKEKRQADDEGEWVDGEQEYQVVRHNTADPHPPIQEYSLSAKQRFHRKRQRKDDRPVIRQPQRRRFLLKEGADEAELAEALAEVLKTTPDGCRSVFVGNLAKEANELGEFPLSPDSCSHMCCRSS